MFKSLSMGLLLALSIFSTNAAQAEFGVRFNPVMILLGFVDVSVDVKVTENVVVSPELLYWNLTIGNTDASVTGYGLEGSYHFNGAFKDGWYLGGFYQTATITVEDSTEKGTVDLTFVGGRGGYAWYWNSFYLNLGAIVGSASDSDFQVKNKSTSVVVRTESVPTGLGTGLDFKLGWYF